jgi:DNA-binding CsgD family transcriptional regulator
MGEVEHVSSLIGDIHQAGLNPALWPTVLGLARAFVGGSAAALFYKDASGSSLEVRHDDGGLDPYYKQLYASTYAKLHPCASGRVLAKAGEPIAAADLLPSNLFRETRFFKEWAQPQGLVDFVCAVLDDETGAMFGVFFHQRDGVVDEATKGRLRLIVPHIGRAVLIGRTIDLSAAEAATLADTVDGLNAGLFLVDATGRLVHANASGRAMLQERSVLSVGGGRLAANEVKSAQALNATFTLAGGGNGRAEGIAVSLTARDGERYIAHVLPLASGARRRAGAGYAAVAALFVRKATLEAPSPPEVIARTFNLTPSELRVLLAIVEVGGVPETAETLGIAEATVKTHLHRLFGKTGAIRQADLVKLVAGFSNPVAGRSGPWPAAARRQPLDERDAVTRLAS